MGFDQMLNAMMAAYFSRVIPRQRSILSDEPFCPEKVVGRKMANCDDDEASGTKDTGDEG